jgi:ABC-2 type transport system permease protein
MVLAMVIYMFIFIYGVQVMKGVNEEKTNRIVEIVISTVRPFELMMGKIWGIAGVALTQFVAWITLTGILSLVVGLFFASSNLDPSGISSQVGGIEQTGGGEVTAIIQQALSLPIGSLILSFIFYFLGGYLVYASLFAAVAAAVDSDSDYQQFMMPITLPLIFAILIATTSVINNPDSTLAVATSIIPLTSPIVMMVRIPFGVPAWEIIASMLALIGFFLVAVWGAGKIYQTGILLYGKKIGYKDMIGWVFRKNK